MACWLWKHVKTNVFMMCLFLGETSAMFFFGEHVAVSKCGRVWSSFSPPWSQPGANKNENSTWTQPKSARLYGENDDSLLKVRVLYFHIFFLIRKWYCQLPALLLPKQLDMKSSFSRRFLVDSAVLPNPIDFDPTLGLQEDLGVIYIYKHIIYIHGIYIYISGKYNSSQNQAWP